MLARPLGILVRPLVHAVVVRDGEPHGAREERRDGEERDVCDRRADERRRLLALRVPAVEQAALVVRIAHATRARLAMVLVPMEGPERALVPAEPMQHVLVDEPLS